MFVRREGEGVGVGGSGDIGGKESAAPPARDAANRIHRIVSGRGSKRIAWKTVRTAFAKLHAPKLRDSDSNASIKHENSDTDSSISMSYKTRKLQSHQYRNT